MKIGTYENAIEYFLSMNNSRNPVFITEKSSFMSLTVLRYINVKYDSQISHATREFLITNNEIRVPSSAGNLSVLTY